MDKFFQKEKDGLRLFVKVTPSARRNAIGDFMAREDGFYEIKISLIAPPEDNKANLALIAFLSEEWDIKKSAISVILGASQRRKVIKVVGQVELLEKKITAWFSRLLVPGNSPGN